MLPESINLPNITYEPQQTTLNDGVYNFNYRSIMTSSQVSPTHTQHVERTGIPGVFSMMINTNDSVYQPSSPAKKMVHINSPSDYADRFKSRPTGRPHIVGFDAMTLFENGGYQDSRGVNGFFPPVKLRHSTSDGQVSGAATDGQLSGVKTYGQISRTTTNCKVSRAISVPSSSRQSTSRRKYRKLDIRPPPLILELAPNHNNKGTRSISSARTAPPGRVTSGRSDITTRSTWSSVKSRKTEPPRPVYGNLIDSEGIKCADQLPKPKLMIGRDNPWVYRYKIKKNMNDVKRFIHNGGQKQI